MIDIKEKQQQLFNYLELCLQSIFFSFAFFVDIKSKQNDSNFIPTSTRDNILTSLLCSK